MGKEAKVRTDSRVGGGTSETEGLEWDGCGVTASFSNSTGMTEDDDTTGTNATLGSFFEEGQLGTDGAADDLSDYDAMLYFIIFYLW